MTVYPYLFIFILHICLHSCFQGTEEEVSVFMFDIKNGSETQLDVARSSVKRLKTLRHPSVLTYLDSLEVSVLQSIFLVCRKRVF